jgi:hypothetical protein
MTPVIDIFGFLLASAVICLIIFAICKRADLGYFNRKTATRDVQVGMHNDGWAEVWKRELVQGREVIQRRYYAKCMTCGFEWDPQNTLQKVMERTAMVDIAGAVHAPTELVKPYSNLPNQQKIAYLAGKNQLDWHRCQAADWMITEGNHNGR